MNEAYSETYRVIGAIMAKYPALTAEEEAVLNEWMAKDGNREIFESTVDNDTRLKDFKRFLEIQQQTAAAKERFDVLVAGKSVQPANVIGWHKWQTYVAAASVIVLISLIGYKWFGEKKAIPKATAPVIVQNNDVQPGQYKARLTLADGSVLVVDSFSKDRLVQQGSTNVYNRDGKLVYKENGKAKSVLYNTLSTEKGQIYGTVLSDGTKVWLNSQSSLRYPVSFNGDIRSVEINGEAYFEVAPIRLRSGSKQPFTVKMPHDIEVEVLGTHFNVNSYNDEEAVRTTLLEGKVKVHTSGNSTTVLQPGQQASLNKQTQALNTIDDVDVDEVVAWRYGYFQFKNADLKTVLRQIARWYDVEVEYAGKVPTMDFLGKLPRNSNLSQVLATLETNEVHFTIQGKKIIVSP
jgi:transmembrane sensor